ncbi:MAG TPA: flavodoxin domain-containing protein [Actinomycetota bacterium]
MGTILVAYATKHGSTEEVAEEIAFSLCDLGWRVDLRSAREVRTQIKDDDLVVLGGAIYSGRLHRDARRFLKRHRKELLKVPVAVFGMGPLGLERETWERSRAQLARNLAKRAWLRPARMTVFGGVDPRKPRWDVDRDLRDWEAIRSWARELPKIVAKPGSTI